MGRIHGRGDARSVRAALEVEQGACRKRRPRNRAAPRSSRSASRRPSFALHPPSDDLLPLHPDAGQRVRVRRGPFGHRVRRGSPRRGRRAHGGPVLPARRALHRPHARAPRTSRGGARVPARRGARGRGLRRGARRADGRFLSRGQPRSRAPGGSTATSPSAAARSSTRARRPCSTRPIRPSFARTSTRPSATARRSRGRCLRTSPARPPAARAASARASPSSTT